MSGGIPVPARQPGFDPDPVHAGGASHREWRKELPRFGELLFAGDFPSGRSAALAGREVDAAEWARLVASDLLGQANAVLAWEDVGPGCLLVGPPGADRAGFARALAASVGVRVTLLSVDSADPRRLAADLGRVAEGARPDRSSSVLLIDGIDLLPPAGDVDAGVVPGACAVTVALEALSAIEGTIVLAACEDPGRVDPGLVRAGRLNARAMLVRPAGPAG